MRAHVVPHSILLSWRDALAGFAASGRGHLSQAVPNAVGSLMSPSACLAFWGAAISRVRMRTLLLWPSLTAGQSRAVRDVAAQHSVQTAGHVIGTITSLFNDHLISFCFMTLVLGYLLDPCMEGYIEV